MASTTENFENAWIEHEMMRASCWRDLSKIFAISEEFWKNRRPTLAFRSYRKLSGPGHFRKQKHMKSPPQIWRRHMSTHSYSLVRNWDWTPSLEPFWRSPICSPLGWWHTISHWGYQVRGVARKKHPIFSSAENVFATDPSPAGNPICWSSCRPQSCDSAEVRGNFLGREDNNEDLESLCELL